MIIFALAFGLGLILGGHLIETPWVYIAGVVVFLLALVADLRKLWCAFHLQADADAVTEMHRDHGVRW